MPPSHTQDFEARVISRLTWRLIPFLFLLYIVAYLDRINVGFAALQMQEQLHFSDRVYGLGAGIFFVGYFFFQLPSNLMLERVGARRWIAALLVVWGLISSSMVFVTTPRDFYILRFLLGTAEAGFFPGVILYLKNWFPVSAHARTVARFMTATTLAGVVGGPISGALLTLQNRAGLAGWQWMFLIEGMPAVLLGVVVLIYLTDKPEQARWLADDQRTWLVETLARENQVQPRSSGGGMFSALTSGRIWLLTYAYFGLATCSYGISLWLPNLIKNLSQSGSLVIGFVSVIPYAAAAAGMVLVGLHSDRKNERRRHVAACAFAGAFGLLIAAYSNSAVLLVVGISLTLAGVSSMLGPFWALCHVRLRGTPSAAGIAIINSIGNLGGLFGPSVIGWVRTSTGSYRGGLLVSGAILALGGCGVLFVRSRHETRATIATELPQPDASVASHE